MSVSISFPHDSDALLTALDRIDTYFVTVTTEAGPRGGFGDTFEGYVQRTETDRDTVDDSGSLVLVDDDGNWIVTISLGDIESVEVL